MKFKMVLKKCSSAFRKCPVALRVCPFPLESFFRECPTREEVLGPTAFRELPDPKTVPFYDSLLL